MFTARYGLTKRLTPRSKVLLEKLLVPQSFKKSHSVYLTRKFITVFTKAQHLLLSSAKSIQSMPPTYSRITILILSSHLGIGLPSGLFPSGFPTKALCAPLLSPTRATCLAHLILLHLITQIVFGEVY